MRYENIYGGFMNKAYLLLFIPFLASANFEIKKSGRTFTVKADGKSITLKKQSYKVGNMEGGDTTYYRYVSDRDNEGFVYHIEERFNTLVRCYPNRVTNHKHCGSNNYGNRIDEIEFNEENGQVTSHKQCKLKVFNVGYDEKKYDDCSKYDHFMGWGDAGPDFSIDSIPTINDSKVSSNNLKLECNWKEGLYPRKVSKSKGCGSKTVSLCVGYVVCVKGNKQTERLATCGPENCNLDRATQCAKQGGYFSRAVTSDDKIKTQTLTEEPNGEVIDQ